MDFLLNFKLNSIHDPFKKKTFFYSIGLKNAFLIQNFKLSSIYDAQKWLILFLDTTELKNCISYSQFELRSIHDAHKIL